MGKRQRKGNFRQVGFWEMWRDVFIASMNKGQFPVALLGLIFITMIGKMPSSDVSKLAFEIVSDLKTGYLVGDVLAVIFALGWFFHAKWQRKLIHDEMRRIAEERNQAQQKSIGERLSSSENR
jgi:hypothetical protein